jgi:hypothetical protein
MMAGTPTHKLTMRPKDKSAPATKIGVAWRKVGEENEEFFGIALDPGVVLNWRDCEDHWITLSRNRAWKKEEDDAAA